MTSSDGTGRDRSKWATDAACMEETTLIHALSASVAAAARLFIRFHGSWTQMQHAKLFLKLIHTASNTRNRNIIYKDSLVPGENGTKAATLRRPTLM